MNNIEIVKAKIFEIRGRQIMLDSDLADLYQVETSQLKRAVRRNIERFEGDDFMFVLTPEEHLRCQNGTSSHGGARYLPFAFTELGVAMLSSVLRSKTAIEVNRGIMRAFVAVRQMLNQPKTNEFYVLEHRIEKLENYIEEILKDVNDTNEDTRIQIELINDSLAELLTNKIYTVERKKIGFKPD